MDRWRRSRKSPGGAPLTDKRALYIKLMNQGESNAAASRAGEVAQRTEITSRQAAILRALGIAEPPRYVRVATPEAATAAVAG